MVTTQFSVQARGFCVSSVHVFLCFFVECGGGFTSKLEGMFKDMELSKDIMLAFKQVRTHLTMLLLFSRATSRKLINSDVAWF